MAEDRKGSSEHAAQHQHGIQARPEPAAPQTVEQRVAKLERDVEELKQRPVLSKSIQRRVEEQSK